MNLIRVKGYSDNVPLMSIVVEKITVIAVHYQDLNKTAIWVDGQCEEFVSSNTYEEVCSAIQQCEC